MEASQGAQPAAKPPRSFLFANVTKLGDDGMNKPTKEQISSVMAHLGSIKTERKARASRENGKKGGAPKSPEKPKKGKGK